MIYNKKFLVAAAIGALALAGGHAAEVSASNTNTAFSQPAPDTTEKKETRYSQPLIENPAYDPNLYTSFVPQDAVQQYVSHYGGAYGGAPSYFGQAADPSYAVQTGYEGYLVPTMPYGAMPHTTGSALNAFAKMAPVGFGFMRTLFPVAAKLFLAVLTKIAVVAMSTLGVVLAGGLVTSLLCTFTPLCKLSFAELPFLRLKDSAKQLTVTLEKELTQERVKRAAELVRLALQKYNELQSEFGAPETAETSKGAEPVGVAEKKDE